MSKPVTFYFVNRLDWREWLEHNFEKEQEAWLIYPKKVTDKPRILYNDAVEEALCFGWVDSIVKSLDAEYTMQRFTPRKPKSNFSQPNKERLKWLAEENMIHAAVLPSAKIIIKEKFEFPKDIINTIKKDNEVWKNYQKLSQSYKRIRIAYIDSARKRPEEFEKRLSNFMANTRENKLIRGFGGIEKYY